MVLLTVIVIDISQYIVIMMSRTWWPMRWYSSFTRELACTQESIQMMGDAVGRGEAQVGQG
jgi:hypothetical protein